MRQLRLLLAVTLLAGCQSAPKTAAPEACGQLAPRVHLVEGEALAVDHPQLTPMLAARGDLDGDGIDEGVDVVVHQPGGSGSFYYLSVNRGLACGFEPLAAVFIGDRIALDALEVSGGRLSLTFRDRDPQEPMSASPTRLNRWRFALEEGRLNKLAR
ncbi:hypothetical protein FCL40_12290 [Ferrimonas sediminicola]|uniref:Lipoprotein n=1 Tax=Ferrimonas sediminicola TaxID=2569538 RepID=A0A4V5NUZ6_9GAMM|nr:hypothetical protein [Ferrimonas sediminicola]TKB48483.1 hypothetical protein FCL40_12290 [Ferrimonas sediminicola]